MKKNSNRLANLKEPRVMVRAALASLLVANIAMAIVAFKPFGGSADDLRKQESSLRDQLAAAQARLAISKKQVSRVGTAREQGDQFLVKYVVERRTSSSTVYEELTHMAAEAGIQPGQVTYTYDPIEGSDTLQMLTITAGVDGTYPQITKFVNLVDKSPRFFVIDSMQVTAPQNAQKLTVTFKIKTFVRGTEEQEQGAGPEPVSTPEASGGTGGPS
jgi:Tfp pilus assembly protein PilO